MFDRLHKWLFVLLLAVFATGVWAETKQPPVSIVPVPRTEGFPWLSVEGWRQLFEEDVAVARRGGVDLLFVGDSITQGWPESLWQTYFARYRPANFGIAGDQTGNVLWRLENGEIEKLSPRAIVLMIGVNNFGVNNEGPAEVFLGVQAVVSKLRETYPGAKILLNGIFPFRETADDPFRALVIETNNKIRTLDDGEKVFFYDYGQVMLEKDGSISPEIMPDFLHPSEAGYRRWAEAMLPTLQQWLD